MGKKVTLIILSLALIGSTITVVFLQNSGHPILPTRYSEYTTEHSLTRKYTEKDYEKSQKLIAAIKEKDKQKIKEMLNSNMEFNCPDIPIYERDDMPILTPLGTACWEGDNETAYKLIAKGSTAKFISGAEAVIANVARSFEKGDLDLIKLLIKKGAHPTEYEPDYYSPILNAAGMTRSLQNHQSDEAQEALEIFKLFESMGADINEQYYGNNVLIEATLGGNMFLLKYLIEEKGMDINHRDTKGDSALMWAAYWEKKSDVVKYLLEHGADKTITNVHGETALNIALKRGNQKNVELLSQ